MEHKVISVKAVFRAFCHREQSLIEIDITSHKVDFTTLVLEKSPPLSLYAKILLSLLDMHLLYFSHINYQCEMQTWISKNSIGSLPPVPVPDTINEL